MKKALFYLTPGKEFLKLFVYTAVTISALYCCSCTPQKRLYRLQKRHPTLFDRANDTMIVKDKFRLMIPGTKVDTVLPVSDVKRDTVVIYQEGITTKVYIHNDSLFISTKTDTIYKDVVREIKVPYTKYIVHKKPRDGLSWVLIIISALLLVVARYEIKRRKPPNKDIK